MAQTLSRQGLHLRDRSDTIGSLATTGNRTAIACQYSGKAPSEPRVESGTGHPRFRIRYDRDQQIIHARNHMAHAALCYHVLIRQPA
ncbi:hypothetical protein A6X21_08160 [Planctopirus hydrillae]|uniref:Uncharacterized protein n=1 Tax=Planctopirus hydrillae TaxID=1841610 RepID=A0A1C3E8S4_9PLAN|nr:hypothetical protein A6X21_08160 [Planctopirus hydrillae]